MNDDRDESLYDFRRWFYGGTPPQADALAPITPLSTPAEPPNKDHHDTPSSSRHAAPGSTVEAG